jgi:hypothetical protein
MTALEVAQKVKQDHQALLFRERAKEPGQYDVRDLGDRNPKGWVILDGWSASAIVAVYENLNEKNRATFAALPLIKMAVVAMKLIK